MKWNRYCLTLLYNFSLSTYYVTHNNISFFESSQIFLYIENKKTNKICSYLYLQFNAASVNRKMSSKVSNMIRRVNPWKMDNAPPKADNSVLRVYSGDSIINWIPSDL